MAIHQLRSRRKASGGRYVSVKKKKQRYLGSIPTHTKVDVTKKRTIRISGGSNKNRLLTCNIVNIYDPKSKKHFKIDIEGVVDNPANRNFIRRNIMTKGAVIKTPKGDARVTSRPGQEGSINAVLIK
ncbi:MAG: 30S ribosomal protein S8e [Candidatus Nanoarchaeia archaeon]|nr:30S ribosomal protein S8e [Candidatus Nanoarchaeia archaeon]